jgi:hypothetical protein
MACREEDAVSVHAAPVQAGGVAVLGASYVKSGGAVVARGAQGFALTGAAALQFLTMLAMTLITLGALLVRRGRGTSLGDGTFD